MRFLKLPLTMSSLGLLMVGCVSQQIEENNSTSNNQKQPVLQSNNKPKETTNEEVSSSFLETVGMSTDISYAVHKGYLDIDLDGGERKSITTCNFMPPPSWGAITVTATVIDAEHNISDECSEGVKTLSNHHESNIKIQTNIRGEIEAKEITLLYRIDSYSPRLKRDDNIIVSFVEEDGMYFAIGTVFIEEDPQEFEANPTDGEGRILSTQENAYVDMPSRYGDLLSDVISKDVNYIMSCPDWNVDGKQILTSRLFRDPGTPCDEPVVTGGGENPPEGNNNMDD